MGKSSSHIERLFDISSLCARFLSDIALQTLASGQKVVIWIALVHAKIHHAMADNLTAVEDTIFDIIIVGGGTAGIQISDLSHNALEAKLLLMV